MRLIDIPRIALVLALSGIFASQQMAAQEGNVGGIASNRSGRDFNGLVLQAVRSMPEGGEYAVTSGAKAQLAQAVRVEGGSLVLTPDLAKPSFCSGATYLVLLKTVELAGRNGLNLPPAVATELAIRGQRDGDGIWGRWNANGPGTARLFHELGLGHNFTDYAAAKPGDFMKIFWTEEIGKLERGHSVVFLGTSSQGGEDTVTFWSSNKPGGYGVKTVPRRKIARAIFSRLDNLGAINNATTLPKSDRFLADMLVKRFTIAEVGKNCGFEAPR